MFSETSGRNTDTEASVLVWSLIDQQLSMEAHVSFLAHTPLYRCQRQRFGQDLHQSVIAVLRFIDKSDSLVSNRNKCVSANDLQFSERPLRTLREN